MSDYRYKVSISKQAEPGLFRVIWLDMEKGTENFFEVPASKIMEMSEKRLMSWKKPGNRLAAGKELFDFLDGSPRQVRTLLKKGPTPPKNSNKQKLWEVQKPFLERVSGRRRQYLMANPELDICIDIPLLFPYTKNLSENED